MKQATKTLWIYLLDRAREPSTWRGLVLMGTAAGAWELSTAQSEQIIAAGLALAGIIGAFAPDPGPNA